MALIAAACLPLAHASNFVKIMVHSGCFGKFTGKAQPRGFLFRNFPDTRFAFPGIMLQRANFPKAGSDVREYILGPNTEYADTRAASPFRTLAKLAAIQTLSSLWKQAARNTTIHLNKPARIGWRDDRTGVSQH